MRIVNPASNSKAAKVSFRWRKASATWVIYVSGKVYESGFGSEDEARKYFRDREERLARKETNQYLP